jgi:hypothetical protein
MPRRNNPKSKLQAPKIRRPRKRRSIIALGASTKKSAGPMKDRRVPRGGSKNEHREYLKEADDSKDD